MTTSQIRNPNLKLETVIRSILGKKMSAEVEKLARVEGVSFERKWRSLMTQGMALR